MSLMPRSLLIIDSHRSPAGAARATTRPRMNAEPRSPGSWPNGVIRPTTSIAMAKVVTIPPIRPSIVLLGLTAERGLRPIIPPTTKPPMS